MGTTVDNIHIYTDEPIHPATLRTIVPGSAFVTPPVNGWVTLFPDFGGGAGSSIPEELSRQSGKLVVSFWSFDSDYAESQVFRGGELITTIRTSVGPFAINEFEALCESGFDGTVEDAAEMTGMTVEELLQASASTPLFEDTNWNVTVTGEAQPLCESLQVTTQEIRSVIDATHDEFDAAHVLASILARAGIVLNRSMIAHRHIERGGHEDLGELTRIG